MARKKTTGTTPEATRWEWLTGPWTVGVAVVGTIGAVLLHINPVLSSVRALPGEMRKTSGQFSSWYYEDQAWTGSWSNDPEGYVDAADMNLSSEPFALELNVKHGVIDGTVSTPQICASTPAFEFFLISGHVDTFGDSAKVVVWDTIGGHHQDFAELKLERDGIMMLVAPQEGILRLFPPKARIARDITKSAEERCKGKQAAFLQAVKAMVNTLPKPNGVPHPNGEALK